MTNEYNYVDHAEPSEIDELFKDFQKKCIDTLYNNVESEIDAIIKQNAQLTKENEKYREIRMLANKKPEFFIQFGMSHNIPIFLFPLKNPNTAKQTRRVNISLHK